VDALAALLMVVIFVLLILTLGQFFLTDALSGRDRALSQLNARVAELADLLSMEQASTTRLESLVDELRASLSDTQAQRSALDRQLRTTQTELAGTERELTEANQTIEAQLRQLAGLETDVRMLQELKAQLEQEVANLAGALDSSRRDAQVQAEMNAEQQAQLTLLNRQINQLREQLGALSEALDVAEKELVDRNAEIEDLGRRLNLALASKVQKLAAYRSEFFGRLKEALGDNPDLRVEGDRFVFQSELLFETGSAQLGDQGRAQVRRLVNTLSEVALRIPADLDWVLRIDGHTDRRPITTPQFPSNWELSTGRALAIVKYMVELGVEPSRLAATGFGQHHPLDNRDNELAYARNRRIEIKLTSR
jgi:chemotaxis protein MotB